MCCKWYLYMPRTPSQGGGSEGGRNLLSPTGGRAYGIRVYDENRPPATKTTRWRNVVFNLDQYDFEEETDRREGKCRHCWLGDVLESRTGHLAARIIWRKDFRRTSILGDWWFGVVWTDDHPFFWSIHSAKSPFFYSSIYSNCSVAKSVVRHGIERIQSPKQQRRPLASILSISSSKNMTIN